MLEKKAGYNNLLIFKVKLGFSVFWCDRNPSVSQPRQSDALMGYSDFLPCSLFYFMSSKDLATITGLIIQQLIRDLATAQRQLCPVTNGAQCVANSTVSCIAILL